MKVDAFGRWLMSCFFVLSSGCTYYPTASSVDPSVDRIVQESRAMIDADQKRREVASRQTIERHVQARQQNWERFIAERKIDLNNLQLDQAQAIALRFNREFMDQRDSNKSSALDLASARHIFDPRLSSTLSYFANWAKDTGGDFESLSLVASGSLGLDYRSEIGTSVSASATTSNTHQPLGGKDTNTSALDLSVTQPLLRGGGRLVNREPLTQAERSMVYRLRDFELFRQSFAIGMAREYYGLVSQRQFIENNRIRLKSATDLFELAKARFAMEKVPEIDVFQAEQDLLQAENALRDAEESYDDLRFRFKILLGLPDTVSLNVPLEVVPASEKVQLEEALAVDLAFENRLDLSTARDQVEDARRGVRIAHNSLLPDLAVTANAGTSADAGARMREQVFNRHNASGGVTLVIPLDRTNEQIAYKQSQLGLERTERAFDLFKQELSSNVRSILRNVIRLEKNIAIQRRLVEASEKSVKVAEIRFRAGTRTSRDVVDAQVDFLNAKNTLIAQTVDYAIAVLEMQRSLGLLRVDAEGKPIGMLNPLLARNQAPRIETEDKVGAPKAGTEQVPMVDEEEE